ncbi:MAG: hypothetical protein ABL927_02540 [Bdellovibrionales bacterium]
MKSKNIKVILGACTIIVILISSAALAISFSERVSLENVTATELAENEEFWVNPAQSGEFYFSYYQENKYIVDRFSLDSYGIQRKQSHNVFEIESAKNSFLNKHSLVKTTASDLFANLFRDSSSLKVNYNTIGKVIWQSEEAWSIDWEKKYTDWIVNNFNVNFFEETNIAVDCADVAYALRWIFSRINKLPMGSTLMGSGKLFTNESMHEEWLKLKTNENWKKDERFLAALNYVLSNTFTHTLVIDSYPVAVNGNFLTPGAHYLNIYSEDSGHTQIVSEINREFGGLFLTFSSTPREVRELWTEYFYERIWFAKPSEGGLLKIRWLEKLNNIWVLRPANKMPGFSLEQYNPKFANNYDGFSDAVEARLGAKTTEVEKMNQAIKTLDERLRARIAVVEEGYLFCKKNDCSPNTLNYENWSTSRRDSRIVQSVVLIDLKTDWSSELFKIWLKYTENRQLLIEKKNISIDDVVSAFRTRNYSVDPRDNVLKRWGQLP